MWSIYVEYTRIYIYSYAICIHMWKETFASMCKQTSVATTIWSRVRIYKYAYIRNICIMYILSLATTNWSGVHIWIYVPVCIYMDICISLCIHEIYIHIMYILSIASTNWSIYIYMYMYICINFRFSSHPSPFLSPSPSPSPISPIQPPIFHAARTRTFSTQGYLSFTLQFTTAHYWNTLEHTATD